MSEKQNGPDAGEKTEAGATWWRVTSVGRVEPVEVVSFTEQTVTIREGGDGRLSRLSRVKRMSSWRSFFPTEAEAIGYVVGHAVQDLDRARAAVRREEARLATLRERYPDAPEWATAQESEG